MSYVREPFEELDVMNYFMFNKLTTTPETSERFCRCMLKNLLGIEVGKVNIKAEQIELPDDPEKRGVRLDVAIEESAGGNITSIYDIEPHRDFESSYPKKNRFTQAQIDKNLMKSGNNDFSKMPNLYIICITNYDPFGYGRLLYTIKNQCVEAPDLVYNDGVKVLYFNTTGTIGGSEALSNFLKYLEESKSANVVDDATKEIDDYVGVIKNNYAIGGKYMTVGDLIDKIVDEAVAEKEAEKDATIAGKDATIAEKDATIAERDARIAELEAQLSKIKK